ncbi:MAG: tetratricopeptide repeat protein [Planctomycetes bacterium]|nr:tetratricopeptide repeat protein [Planctomycetota bacterium]
MSARDLYREAEILKNEGKLAEAVVKYDEVLAEDPSFALALHASAVACAALGEYERAIEYAQRACALEPTDPFAFMSLSVTFRRAFEGTRIHRYIQLAEDAMARSNALRMP